MDYRLIQVSRISWCANKACYGAGKVQFQTPPAPYQVTPAPRLGGDAREIILHHVPKGFRQFVEDLEASVNTNDLGGRQCISMLTWDGEMRMTLFQNDTLFFDIDGQVIQGLQDTGVCACLVQVVGVWTSARSWGLKCVVKEVKEMDPLKVTTKPSSSWAFREDCNDDVFPSIKPACSDWLFRD